MGYAFARGSLPAPKPMRYWFHGAARTMRKPTLDAVRRIPAIAWILAAVAVLHVIGLGWGLPASDGWDNDGVAPRDFLVILAQAFSSGPYDFAFLHLPLVHPLVLGLLTLPVTLTALVHAPSLAPADVIHEIIRVPYMTANALIARLVSAGMSLGIVYALAQMGGEVGEQIGGRGVALCVAAVAGVNAMLNYYAHTTNLEVPSLFWASFALLALVRAMVRREPGRLRTFAILAAVAVANKDQTAGLFVLGVPLALGFWALTDAWVRGNARSVMRE